MRTTIVCFFIFLLTTSCVKLALNQAGILDEKVKINTLNSDNKKVIFFEMHHIGKKEFYEDVKNKADSLQKLGYDIFYEGIIKPEYLTKEEQILFAKKHRKITGTSGNLYLDTISNKLFGKYKFPKKQNLINQPPNESLFDVLHSKNIDAQLDSIILKFENLHGVVELSNCDLETDLYDPSFDCETLDGKSKRLYRSTIVLDYRNELIVDSVQKNKNKKIALIYGKAHFEGIKEKLEKLGFEHLKE